MIHIIHMHMRYWQYTPYTVLPDQGIGIIGMQVRRCPWAGPAVAAYRRGLQGGPRRGSSAPDEYPTTSFLVPCCFIIPSLCTRRVPGPRNPKTSRPEVLQTPEP